MSGAKELIGFTLIAVVCLLLATAAVVARGNFAANRWTIQWVEVSGPFERVSAEQIRATAAPLAVGGFLGVDLERIRQSVEALPWVRAAGVRKQWPDKLRIRVLEHQPLAQWDEGRLVSALGEVFSVGGVDRIEGLPKFSGADGEAAQVARFYRDLNAQLQGTGLDVVAVNLTRRAAWTVELTGGVSLLIGREDVAARLDRLMTVIGELRAASDRHLESIDLRYTNGLAVRWRVEQSPALAAGPRLERL